MKIYFVRHGSALFDLSAYGQKQMRATANFLKELMGGSPDTAQIRLLTSPQIRAVSSAKIIQEALNLSEPLAVNWLRDGASYECDAPEQIAGFSVQNPGIQSIIAVSHLPEVEGALESFGERFGWDFYPNAKNGSVYLVDTDTKEIKKLFQP